MKNKCPYLLGGESNTPLEMLSATQHQQILGTVSMRREWWPLVVHGLLALVDPAIIGEIPISLLLGNDSRYGATASSQNNHASRWDVWVSLPY